MLKNITIFPMLLTFIFNQVYAQTQHFQVSSSESSTTEQSKSQLLTMEQIWGFGILSGVVISLIGFIAGILIIVAKRLCHVRNFDILIKFLFSLSCGALIGDGIINVLGQAFRNQETSILLVSLIFIGSVALFLILDRVLHHYDIAHPHWGKDKCQRPHADHTFNKNQPKQGQEPLPPNNIEPLKSNPSRLDPNNLYRNSQQVSARSESMRFESYKLPKVLAKIQKNVPVQSSKNLAVPAGQLQNNPQIQSNAQILNSQIIQDQPQNKVPTPEEQYPELEPQPKSDPNKNCIQNLRGKGSAGYMSIIGSGIHNLFDGLALGVQFAAADPTHIIPAGIAMITHQIPRQLGDVVIMLKTNFTEGQALFFNGMVNILSIIGVVIGLAVVNLSQTVRLYIMVFVAGNFLYVASQIWGKILKNKGKHKNILNIMEFAGFCVGVGVMFLLTLF